MQAELLTGTSPEHAAKLIIDSRFGLQEKRDGVRLLVRRQGNTFEGWNKQGQPTSVHPVLASALCSLNIDEFILDGEFESPHFYCWDLLSAQGTDLGAYAYGERYKILQVFRGCSTVTVLPCWTDEGDKERMVYEFRVRRAEGVVFKNLEAPYRAGRAQPVFLRVREDVSTEDCSFEQVKISKKWD